jgi:transcriptional regulator with XRE-family HTH domain
MDAFDRIAARTPEHITREVEKNLAIAVRIINILKVQGKTKQDLARLLDVPYSEVNRWLTGSYSLELKTIYQIESILDTQIISIVEDKTLSIAA